MKIKYLKTMKNTPSTTILIVLISPFAILLLKSLLYSLNHHDIKSIITYNNLYLLLLIIFLAFLFNLKEKLFFKKHEDHKIIIAILKALQDNKAGEYLNLKTINHDTPKGKYCCWLLLDKGLAIGASDTSEDQGYNAILYEITELGKKYLKEPFSLL